MTAATDTIADYTPKVAIVTGAAKGIGRAIALRLADDGFDVVVNDIPQQLASLQELVDLIKAKGKNAVAVVGDVSVEEDVERLVAETVQVLGGVDVMIANAGTGGFGTIFNVDMNNFDRVIAVNLRGVVLCYKYAAIQMRKQKRGGRLIAASSVLGKKAVPNLQAYCASKFGVRAVSQSVAQELLPYKITVNTYAPGLILTDMTDSPKDAVLGGKHGSHIKSLFNRTPDAPDAEPPVVASIVSYLCKPEAYFVNGQSISVCGGLTMD
ncbi:hypothetical protein EUX98_g2450 [Antrodiella citrinella]|uniref:3-oxoacyl-[acyl-carrier-protein] reductase n=1 Tax=Antrodiella citrinella TaxID=2447956 RepID=A0A4S4MYW8_9APHY|nr:hypothetical protein EUX98_g2450 [Antrodiella citrinella]